MSRDNNSLEKIAVSLTFDPEVKGHMGRAQRTHTWAKPSMSDWGPLLPLDPGPYPPNPILESLASSIICINNYSITICIINYPITVLLALRAIMQMSSFAY